MKRTLLACLACLLPLVLHAEERPLLIVVDQSFSMQQNDPKRFAVDSVQLALAVLRERKDVAIVGFHQSANDLLTWTAITDHAQRAKLRDLIEKNLTFPGKGTRYVKALERAHALLEARSAPEGTKVIFFTDGEADDRSADITAIAERFAQRGWIIDSMRLNTSNGKPGPDLANISRLTRGRTIEVTNAATLIDRFVELAASENDYFTLDAAEVKDASSVAVPPGARSLVYLVAKNEAKSERGNLASLACDGAAIGLAGAEAYRYPDAAKAGASQANIEVALINRPRAGTYVAEFAGVPHKVYVSLALDLSIDKLAIPETVNEGDNIVAGVRLLCTDPNQAAYYLSKAVVSVTINDAGGATLLSGRANGSITSAGAVFSLPWQVRLADTADRTVRQPLSVAYQVTLDRWSVAKHDAFTVVPAVKPLPPPVPAAPPPPVATTAAWKQPGLTLATWVGLSAEGQLEATTTGPAGSLSIVADQGFRFPTPLSVPGSSAVPVRFLPVSAGRFRPQLTVQGIAAGTAAPVLPALEGRGYPWNGPEALPITSAGPTGIPEWSPGHPELPAQPFAGATAELRDPAGTVAKLTIDAKGVASLAVPATQAATTFTGTVPLRFGTLPLRQLAVSWAFSPSKPELAWGEISFPSEANAWKTASWATGTQPVKLANGAAGTLSVVFQDLVGPEGERLLAAYDLRGSFNPARVQAGEEGKLEIQVFRGRDVLPGTYTGTYAVTFTADNGVVETYNRPLSVTIPAARLHPRPGRHPGRRRGAHCASGRDPARDARPHG